MLIQWFKKVLTATDIKASATSLRLSVYTGPDKFLHRGILYLDRLFTRNSENSVTDHRGV